MNQRPYKGKSLFTFLDNYTVVDIETTGFWPSDSEILEISALRVRKGQPTEAFSTLVKPSRPVPYFITDITGITNSMVQNAAPLAEALEGFVRFLGSDAIVGYNVNFDINFLYDNLLRVHGVLLTNSFVDVLRIARKMVRNLPNYKQTTLAEHFGVSVQGAHRALRDCEICQKCYATLRKMWLGGTN